MSGATRHIKVLVIDDSAVVRKLLGAMLAADPEIEVVGTAHDAYIAREKIKRLKPDVLTLDVEMPRMDGLTFLGNLMRLHPLPVVMVSTLTAKGADVTLDALELGAVDFVCKPKLDLSHTFEDYAGEVIAKVKQAARARVHQRQTARAAVPTVLPPLAQGQDRSHGIDEVFPKGMARRWRGSDQLIAIGASTGGTEAIREVLQRFPLDVPGIVVAQHIPAGFSKAFADRLNAHCAITVCQAADGDPILPGHAYVAPGDRHLLVVRDGARWRCRLSDELPVNRHKPSVDALFRSVAQSAGPSAVGVLFTGMGKDGALGLKDILEAGGRTLAQDEASSVVWGMPGAAVQLGACRETVPLPRISERVLELIVQAREAA